MSPAERLHALEMMYAFARSLGLHECPEHVPNERWLKIKQKWLQQNPHLQKGLCEH